MMATLFSVIDSIMSGFELLEGGLRISSWSQEAKKSPVHIQIKLTRAVA